MKTLQQTIIDQKNFVMKNIRRSGFTTLAALQAIDSAQNNSAVLIKTSLPNTRYWKAVMVLVIEKELINLNIGYQFAYDAFLLDNGSTIAQYSKDCNGKSFIIIEDLGSKFEEIIKK